MPPPNPSEPTNDSSGVAGDGGRRLSALGACHATGFFNASVEEGGANPNCGAIPREYVRFMLQYLYVHSGSDWSFRVHCPHQIEALLEEKSPELMPIYKVRLRKQTRAGEREREGGNVCVCVCVSVCVSARVR